MLDTSLAQPKTWLSKIIKPPKCVMEHEYLYHFGSHSMPRSYLFPKRSLHIILLLISFHHDLFNICLQQRHAPFPYTETRLWKAKRYSIVQFYVIWPSFILFIPGGGLGSDRKVSDAKLPNWICLCKCIHSFG